VEEEKSTEISAFSKNNSLKEYFMIIPPLKNSKKDYTFFYR